MGDYLEGSLGRKTGEITGNEIDKVTWPANIKRYENAAEVVQNTTNSYNFPLEG